ncbi:MAG: DMT family transporter [Clostridia bacterium]|jgi:transporter family-2 protein|nr:DMT family transporter [Clostridia bacterium]
MSKATALFFAILAGICMGSQPAINGFLGKELTTKVAVLISLLISIVIMLVINLFSFDMENYKKVLQVPLFYVLAGGILGAVIIYYAARVVPILGSTVAISVFIVVQLIVSVLIDHFGLFGIAQSLITTQKLIGIVLLLSGLSFIVR